MIVTELMEKGSLKDIIKREGAPSFEQTIQYAIDIADAMSYVHYYGIIHRDLKCDNILVNRDNVAKVADLGLAREIDIDNGMTVMAGTPKWEAPEVLVAKKGKGRQYSTSADVWSYGMLLYEMVSGEDPFSDVHDIFELKKVIVNKGKRPKIPKTTNKELKALMKECWKSEPDKRPEFKVIVTKLNNIREKPKTQRGKNL